MKPWIRDKSNQGTEFALHTTGTFWSLITCTCGHVTLWRPALQAQNRAMCLYFRQQSALQTHIKVLLKRHLRRRYAIGDMAKNLLEPYGTETNCENDQPFHTICVVHSGARHPIERRSFRDRVCARPG